MSPADEQNGNESLRAEVARLRVETASFLDQHQALLAERPGFLAEFQALIRDTIAPALRGFIASFDRERPWFTLLENDAAGAKSPFITLEIRVPKLSSARPFLASLTYAAAREENGVHVQTLLGSAPEERPFFPQIHTLKEITARSVERSAHRLLRDAVGAVLPNNEAF